MISDNNYNKLELLIPDYINGKLSDSDRHMLEEGFRNHPELKDLYNEMRSGMEAVGSVQYKQPDEIYWTNMLPEIHKKIEYKKATLFDLIFSKWKIVIPAISAVVLFVLYYSVLQNKIDDQPQIIVINDTLKQNIAEIPAPEVKDSIVIKEKKSVKQEPVKSIIKKDTIDSTPIYYAFNDQEDDEQFIIDYTDDQSEILSEETEKEIEELEEKEKEELIEMLKNIDI